MKLTPRFISLIALFLSYSHLATRKEKRSAIRFFKFRNNEDIFIPFVSSWIGNK
jgi:hypothetical protein